MKISINEQTRKIIRKLIENASAFAGKFSSPRRKTRIAPSILESAGQVGPSDLSLNDVGRIRKL